MSDNTNEKARAIQYFIDSATSIITQNKMSFITFANPFFELMEENYDYANRRVKQSAQNFFEAISRNYANGSRNYLAYTENIPRYILEIFAIVKENSIKLQPTELETLRSFIYLLSQIAIKKRYQRDINFSKYEGSEIQIAERILFYFVQILKSKDSRQVIQQLSFILTPLFDEELATNEEDSTGTTTQLSASKMQVFNGDFIADSLIDFEINMGAKMVENK